MLVLRDLVRGISKFGDIHRKEAIMDGITTREKAQSRIYRMRWWTLVLVSVTVLLAAQAPTEPVPG